MSFEDQLLAFQRSTSERMGNVVKRSAQRVFEMAATTQPSVVYTGGSFVVGKVPVLTGLLVGTSELRVNGSVVAVGTVAEQASSGPDFVKGLGGMKLGDTVEYAFIQPYAPDVEYGTGRSAGRFYVRGAVVQWDNIVKEEVTRAN